MIDNKNVIFVPSTHEVVFLAPPTGWEVYLYLKTHNKSKTFLKTLK